MFTKHVWHDPGHRAEIFISDKEQLIGAIVSYKGAVCLVNPRSEILTALYNEGKINRLLSINALILTDNTIDFTRGICGFINYSRALKRQTPLRILTGSHTTLSTDFLDSFCSRLYGDTFPIDIAQVKPGQRVQLGDGVIRFVRPRADDPGNPCLVVQTPERRLDYFDESHGAASGQPRRGGAKARTEVIIRAADLLKRTALEV